MEPLVQLASILQKETTLAIIAQSVNTAQSVRPLPPTTVLKDITPTQSIKFLALHAQSDSIVQEELKLSAHTSLTPMLQDLQLANRALFITSARLRQQQSVEMASTQI